MTELATEVETEIESTVSDVSPGDVSEDEALGAIWDSHNEPETVEAEDSTSTDNDAENEAEDTASTSSGRDEKGRFTSSKPEEEPAAEAADDTSDASDEPETTDQKGDAEQASVAPSHLPYDIKANWQNIPEAAREAITAINEERNAKNSELGRELANVKPLRDVVDNYKEYFDGTKGNYKPEEAVNYLFSVQKKLDADPLGTLMEIAQTYGVAQHLVAPTDGTREIAQLNQTIRDLQVKLESQTDPGNIDERISKTLEEREFNKALDEFAKTADHYADIEDKLPAYIQASWVIKGENADKLDVLKHAYNMATNDIPDVRAKIEAAKELKTKAAQASDPKRTESAKRAASANVKSNGTGKSTSYSSEEEAMAAAYDRSMAS